MAWNKDTYTSENFRVCHLLSLPVIATLKDNCHPCVLDEIASYYLGNWLKLQQERGRLAGAGLPA